MNSKLVKPILIELVEVAAGWGVFKGFSLKETAANICISLAGMFPPPSYWFNGLESFRRFVNDFSKGGLEYVKPILALR
jgi:hypothetical protein